MAEVDAGVVLGLCGIVLALGSLAYARSQAAAARRQAEEARRLGLLGSARELYDRLREVRWEIVRNPTLWAEFAEANPRIAEALHGAGDDPVPAIVLRDFLDATQDVFLLRREGVVSDAYWNSWTASLAANLRMPTCGRVLENAEQRGIYDPDFVAFLRTVREGGPVDPLKGAAPAPSP